MPKVRIHWEGSAAPQVWPIPRPPIAPMVLPESRRISADARQRETIFRTSDGSSWPP
jgi:hypothetical protein